MSLESSKLSENSEPLLAGTSPCLLIIDDNSELVSVLGSIFETEGFRVYTGTSVKEGIDQLRTCTPDLIICDVMMPDELGYELHRYVREQPELCSIPFLFLTASTSVEDKQFAVEWGCDDYLTKPFDNDDLIAVVRGKLTLAKQRKRMASAQFDGYRRRIIHTLSHEFRTPLVSISTGTELLIEQHENLEAAQLRRLLESVWRGGQRLERLVDDFMMIQQIDLGHAEHTHKLYAQSVAVDGLIESSIESFKSTLLSGDTVSVDIVTQETKPDEKLYVKVYDIQVSGILQRLMSNAHKFGGKGNPITVSVEHNDSKIVISVRDRGPGLSDDRELSIEDACKAFSQIDRDIYEQQGCGLGLTIAQYFTFINGGKLSLLRPIDGIGLEARITFPRMV